MIFFMMWFVPGILLAGLVGIGHWAGEYTPTLDIRGKKTPFSVIYGMILVLGPVLLVLMLINAIRGSNA